MRAGDLKRRIRIMQPTTAQDDYGQPGAAAGPDEVVLETWASIVLATQRERYQLGPGFTGDISHTVCIRWTPTPLASGMKVLYQTRIFDLQVVCDPDEEQREQKLLCLELTK